MTVLTRKQRSALWRDGIGKWLEESRAHRIIIPSDISEAYREPRLPQLLEPDLKASE